MNKKKKTLNNFIFSIISQVVTIALAFILPRLFIANYGSDVNGLLSSLQQIFAYLSILEAGVGAATQQALYKPVALSDRKKANHILAATNKFYKKTALYYLVLLVVVSFVYAMFVQVSLNFISVVLISIFLGLPSVVNFYCQAKYRILLEVDGRNYINTNLTLAASVMINLTKIVLLTLGVNIVYVIMGSFFISTIQAIITFFYIRHKYSWIDLSVEPDEKAISQKNSVLIHQISSLIFSNTDVLVLTVFCDLKVVSVYSMYKLIISGISSLLGSLSTSVQFALGQMLAVDKKKFCKWIDIFDTYYIAFTYGIYSVASVLILPFLELYTQGVQDINYIDLKLLVLFLTIELLLQTRTAMSISIIFAGHFKLTLSRTITESIINLSLSLLFVNMFGIYGVLMGTVVAMLYRTNDVIFYNNKRILERGVWQSYRLYFANIITFGIVAFVLSKITFEFVSYFAIVKIAVGLCLIILPIFLIISSLANYRQTIFLLKKLKHQISKK